jgi:colicin import membrane protein
MKAGGAELWRELKVYQTALGFFDQAAAAPSIKAALEASVSNSNLFRQGAARETDDSEIVRFDHSERGVVLRRAVGSSVPFTENMPPAHRARRLTADRKSPLRNGKSSPQQDR